MVVFQFDVIEVIVIDVVDFISASGFTAFSRRCEGQANIAVT